MKRYAEYKDTGVAFLGEIPLEWTISKLKYCVKVRNIKKNYLEGIYVGLENIEPLNGRYIEVNNQEINGVSSEFVSGDVLFGKLRPYLGKCIVAEFNGMCSTEFLVLEPLKVCNRYLKYWFLSAPVVDAINASTYGAKMPRANWDHIGEMALPLPAKCVQTSIANYLDTKVNAIDATITDKDKQIRLLEEKQVSIITTAVTKGINSTTEMKDSGTEWLGYIPSHWRVVPAKALFAQSKETRHETDVQLTASQKYGIISQEDYMERQNYKIVLADKGLENWKHVEPNDFIISLRSFQGGLEISYIPGCITWHYIVLKPKAGVEPEYFKWLFKSPRYIQALQRTANFIRDGQDLRFSNFVQVPLPLIPMDEQKEIAEYLNKETARIDSIIADITEQIEKLKEYRQSVISEVVTGKVAVE
ncbi:restriction endonuclease subunit S [Flavonifractor sp. An306]|uniref:restriction endonuclease subunit S n=1 Tax=Flavonifractor sp. An306 TaxID=1965629 RepID=UPI000B3A8032|nr:restriction endonuclease subunit S [Flavonifractor sp. An306]OUO43024.1 hypothetical protein B5F88_03465 [Flavonifractor sp. An306]